VCRYLDVFSCINKKTVLYISASILFLNILCGFYLSAVSIQGWLLFFIFKHFVQFLFEGGFYSKAASIQENTVPVVLPRHM